LSVLFLFFNLFIFFISFLFLHLKQCLIKSSFKTLALAL